FPNNNTDLSPNTITIDLSVKHHAPVGANGQPDTSNTAPTLTANEDKSLTLSFANFGFSDPLDSPADAPSGVIITTTPSVGTLTVNGFLVAAGQFVTVSDISNGLLKYNPPADVNGLAKATFTFQVKDLGGTANGGADTDLFPDTIKIDINSVSDAPV